MKIGRSPPSSKLRRDTWKRKKRERGKVGRRAFGRQWEGGRRLVDCAVGLCSQPPLLSFFSFLFCFCFALLIWVGRECKQSMNRVYNTFFLKKTLN